MSKEFNITMETATIRRAFYAVLAVLLSIFVSYMIGRRDGQIKASEDLVERVDTLFIRDTITQYKPIVEERVRLEKVYVPVEKTDTLWKHDTMYVYLPKEQLIWKDKYSAIFVSGIKPQIDSVFHYVTKEIVTKEVVVPKVKKTRWGIGIQVGYGVLVGNQIQAAPYVGVGLSYDLLSW